MSIAKYLMVPSYGAISLFALAGCGSTYREPVACDCATIRVASTTAHISEVDGKSTADGPSRTMRGLGMFSGGDFPIGKPQVSVTPGKHTIEVQSLVAVADLWLIAAPNGEYIIKFGKATSRGVPIWIEDVRTGEPVGGIKGSDDEPPDEPSPAADGSPGASEAAP